jgi:hypothetical protein
MNALTVIAIIYSIIITILVGILIYLYTTSSTGKISPKLCPHVTGTFGVNPSHSYQKTGGVLAIKSTCGVGLTLPCQATAQTLSDAIAYCNTYINICNAFIYSQTSGQVTIVDETQTSTVDNNYDLYERQK